MSTINRQSKYTTENASFWTCNYHQLVSVFCLVWYKCQCFHMFDRCYSKMPFGDTLFLILWKLSCRRVGQTFWHICCFVSSESCFEAKAKPGADVQKARQILWGCPPQIGMSMCKVDDFGEDAIETSESNCYPTFDPFPTGISSRSCVFVWNVFLKTHSWWLFCI